MTKSQEPPQNDSISAFDPSLGPNTPGQCTFPALIWEWLEIPLMKYLLNFMATDEHFRGEIFEMVLKKMEKNPIKASSKSRPEKAPENSPPTSDPGSNEGP